MRTKVEGPYLFVITLVHFGFAAILLTLFRDRVSPFVSAFSAAWIIEGIRSGTLLFGLYGIEINEPIIVGLDLLYIPATACLLYCAFRLEDHPPPRRMICSYILASGLLYLGGHFSLIPLLTSWADLTQRGAESVRMVLMTSILFVPGALIRGLLAAGFFAYWRQTGLLGALLGAVFSVLFAVGSALVPFQLYYAWKPEWCFLFWFLQVIGLSVAVLLLWVDQQATELRWARHAVASLENLLPLCAQCRRIRTDSGTWVTLERYLLRQSKTVVTHGLCPTCAEELVPDGGARTSDSMPRPNGNISADPRERSSRAAKAES
ncbi:MAG: hypothetical protein P8020_20925 [Acidobacteriota bacterium]